MENSLKLPFSIFLQDRHQIIIRPSKLLYYNRIAKTGSQSFIYLLMKQGEKLGFEVWKKLWAPWWKNNPGPEILADSEEGIDQEIQSVLKINKPMVIVKHYCFIDFKEKLGSAWSPDWFNIVRHPIDKVCLDEFFKNCINTYILV